MSITCVCDCVCVSVCVSVLDKDTSVKIGLIAGSLIEGMKWHKVANDGADNKDIAGNKDDGGVVPSSAVNAEK